MESEAIEPRIPPGDKKHVRVTGTLDERLIDA